MPKRKKLSEIKLQYKINRPLLKNAVSAKRKRNKVARTSRKRNRG